MGLLGKMKELFSAQKYIFKVMTETDRRNKEYASMTLAELDALPDDDLISAALYRTDRKLDAILGKKKKGTPADWSEQLTGAQRTAYILSFFEYDLQTGGLEYFLKHDGGFAPMVSACLSAVGARDHLTLYNEFFSTYGQNLRQTALVEYGEEIAMFDRAYSALPPIEPILVPYLRAHLSEF